MRPLLFFILSFTLFFSCKKKEEVEPANSMSEDLQQTIKAKGVQALQYCFVGGACVQSIGWGADYSFEGDNIVRIRENYYNLNKLDYYKIQTATDGSGTEIRMVLYFPAN